MEIVFALSMESLWVLIPIGCYLFVPVLIIYLTFGMKLPPEVQSISNAPMVPPLSRKYFFRTHEELTPLGFQFHGTYVMRGLVKNVEAYLVIYYHPEEFCGLLATSVYTTIGGMQKLVESYVEMVTNFGGDQKVTTGNQKTLSAFKTNPTIIASFHPRIRDAAQLVAAHQSICRYKFPGKRPIDPRPEDFEANPFQVVLTSLEREMSFAVQSGYLKYQQSGIQSSHTMKASLDPYAAPRVEVARVTYSPTFFGAFRMTWKQLFPIKQFYVFSRNRRSKKLLTESGYRT